MRTLPDYVREGLDIIFVGINPGLYSAEVGHYFARSGNLFWPSLYKSGLVPKRLQPEDDSHLLEYGLGLTDLVKRPSRGATDLSKQELSEGARVICRKLKRFAPQIACFVGLTGFRAVFNEKNAKPGRQQQRIGASRIFVVPSTSRRNAHYQPRDIVRYFKELQRWRMLHIAVRTKGRPNANTRSCTNRAIRKKRVSRR